MSQLQHDLEDETWIFEEMQASLILVSHVWTAEQTICKLLKIVSKQAGFEA